MKTPGSHQINRYFLASAEALLAAFATALFLGNLVSAGLTQPRDTLFAIPINTLFWILGLVAILLIAGCHWLQSTGTKLALIQWFAANLIAVRVGWQWQGASDPTVYLDTLTQTFQIYSTLAIYLLYGTSLYLWAGSAILLIWNYLAVRSAISTTNSPADRLNWSSTRSSEPKA